MPYLSVCFVTHVVSILQFESQDISWRHIIDVYEWDLGMNRASPGLEETTHVKGRTCETNTSSRHASKTSCAGEFFLCKVALLHIKKII